MHRLSNPPTEPDLWERQPRTSRVRSYQQIADILTKREGTRTTPEQVARICQVAELKIIRAVRAIRYSVDGHASRSGGSFSVGNHRR